MDYVGVLQMEGSDIPGAGMHSVRPANGEESCLSDFQDENLIRTRDEAVCSETPRFLTAETPSTNAYGGSAWR